VGKCFSWFLSKLVLLQILQIFYFKCNTSCFNYPLLTLTETWFNNDIADGELNLFSYNIFSCDRNNTTSFYSRVGGIFVGIPVDLPSYLIPVTCLGIEVLFVSFTFNRKKYIISSTCLPPNSPPQSFKSTVENLLSFILTICLFSVMILIFQMFLGQMTTMI